MTKQEFKTKFRQIKRKVSRDFLNLNTFVIAIAAFIAIGWAWGSINAMQKNYILQQDLDNKRRDLLVSEIQTKTLQYEQKYLQSGEYQELAARDKLGLSTAGESVLILPETETASKRPEQSKQNQPKQESNFRQWINFLFGGNARKT